MTGEMDRRVDETSKTLRAEMNSPEWKAMIEASPRLQDMSKEIDLQLGMLVKLSVMLMPALLALESLVALALGWAFYHRMSDVAIGPALGKLQDFRFNDQLVWGVAVGASVYLLKAFQEGKTAGFNLLVFFGFLYAVRGMGILMWMSRGRMMKAMLIIVTATALIFMAPLAFLIGIGDTWLDWRSRAQAKPL